MGIFIVTVLVIIALLGGLVTAGVLKIGMAILTGIGLLIFIALATYIVKKIMKR